MRTRWEDADEYRAEVAEERRARRLTWGCLCGYPDMPGRCPGPAACPMHGQFDEDETTDEEPPMPDLTRETIAELRRLREADAAAHSKYMEAVSAEPFNRSARAKARNRRTRARDDLHIALRNWFGSLLAAAERGLGSGDAA